MPKECLGVPAIIAVLLPFPVPFPLSEMLETVLDGPAVAFVDNGTFCVVAYADDIVFQGVALDLYTGFALRLLRAISAFKLEDIKHTCVPNYSF